MLLIFFFYILCHKSNNFSVVVANDSSSKFNGDQDVLLVFIFFILWLSSLSNNNISLHPLRRSNLLRLNPLRSNLHQHQQHFPLNCSNNKCHLAMNMLPDSYSWPRRPRHCSMQKNLYSPLKNEEADSVIWLDTNKT
jgi:hypothetical protein